MNRRNGRATLLKVASLSVVAFALGVALVLQIRTVSPVYNSMINKQSDTDRAAYLLALYNNVTDLREEVRKLQGEIDSYKSSQDSSAKLGKDVSDMRARNGELAVIGPGVRVDIAGQVTMFDLEDMVNELRNAGAEGISLNGSRVLLRTVIAGDGTSSYVTLDGSPLRAPYRLEAVGSPSDLQTALERKGGLKQLLENNLGLTVEVTRSDRIALPKSSIPYSLTYAKPVVVTPIADGK